MSADRYVSEILTPAYGGHVWDGTWEALQAVDSATCCACGESIRRYGCPIRHRPRADSVQRRAEGAKLRVPVCGELVGALDVPRFHDRTGGPSKAFPNSIVIPKERA